jgi:hypothetical protein
MDTSVLVDASVLTRLHKILAQICDPNEAMQAQGGHAFYRTMRGAGLHPDDLVIESSRHYDHQMRTRVVEEQKRRERQHLNVIEYLTRHIEPKLAKAAWEAMNVTYRWPECIAALHQRFGDKLPAKEQIAGMLKVATKTLNEWEKGSKEIPPAVLAAIAAAELPSSRVRAPRQRQPKPKKQAVGSEPARPLPPHGWRAA